MPNISFWRRSCLLLPMILFARTFARTCPNHLAFLRAAFEVSINLRPPAGQNIFCSRRDTEILRNLVEVSMEEASRKMAEWNPSDVFEDGESKVCNGSGQAKRRLDEGIHRNSGLSTLRLLRKKGLFRYYGGMRCGLCSNDDSDPGSVRLRGILKFDKLAKLMKCHEYSFSTWGNWKGVSTTNPKEKHYYTQDVYAPSVAQEFKIEMHLDLAKQPSWNGQHIYVTINGRRFDLGPFRNGPVVKRSSPKGKSPYGVEWSIRPGWKDQSMHLVEMIFPRAFYKKTNKLKVEVFFGARKGKSLPIRAFFGHIFPAAECQAPKRKLKSIRSSPVLSPVSTPQSSPVAFLVVKKVPQKTNKHYANRSRVGNYSRPRIAGYSSNRMGQVKGRSINLKFQSRLRSTLSTVIEDDAKRRLHPGHCMYAKSITAEVEIVPKPNWEKRLPFCYAMKPI